MSRARATNQYEALDTFDATWDTLAERGMCDARGGMEYTRCREQWDTQDLFFAALASIFRNANIGPPPPTPNPKG